MDLQGIVGGLIAWLVGGIFWILESVGIQGPVLGFVKNLYKDL